MNGQVTYRQEGRAANKVLPQWGLTSFNETFVLKRTVVHLLSFGVKNPPLRQYPNRYTQGVEPTENWFTFDKNGGNIDKLYSSRLQSRKKKI